jgi:hypothetical protein
MCIEVEEESCRAYNTKEYEYVIVGEVCILNFDGSKVEI